MPYTLSLSTRSTKGVDDGTQGVRLRPAPCGGAGGDECAARDRPLVLAGPVQVVDGAVAVGVRQQAVVGRGDGQRARAGEVGGGARAGKGAGEAGGAVADRLDAHLVPSCAGM